jgi:signal transduction histidine kinase
LIDADAQRARLEQLSPLVARRFAILHESVQLRANGGFAGAAAATGTGRGREVMDSIRSVVDAMAAYETARLRERSVAEQRSLRRATTMTAVSFLAAVVLGLAAALVVSRDIDRRLRAEEEARRAKEVAEAASRAKSEFLAMMSHELRTPLNSVIGFSNVLLQNRQGRLRERDLLYLQRIRASGQHLLSLINEVLDLSKVEAGRMRLERAPVALDTLVEDTIASFEGQVRDRSISLDAEIPPHLTPLMTDPAKLLQVLTNLIGNAIKFTGESGSVIVRCRGERHRVVFSVNDTGPGISEEDRAHIFDRYWQAKKRARESLGLGLAISKAIIGSHGGTIWVESTVGVGTSFFFTLPAGRQGVAEAGIVPRTR